MAIKDFYNDRITDLEAGDVIMATVTCHIGHIDHEKQIVYVEAYRCSVNGQKSSEGVPQGAPMSFKDTVALVATLFPILAGYEVSQL